MYSKIDFKVWEDVEPLYKELYSRGINSLDQLEKWIVDRSKLYSHIDEAYARSYINMTRFTDNKNYKKAFTYFTNKILPNYRKYNHTLDRKLYNCRFKDNLPISKYRILLRNIANQMEIFREKNIPLESEEINLSSNYGKTIGNILIEFEGKEYTLQQIRKVLKSPIRERRKKAWESMKSELYKHNRYLENLFDNLKVIRVSKALNAGFKNYRDYMFKVNNRFDYTPDDCFEFHNAVKNIIVPITEKLFDERKKKLDIDTIKPWDKIAEAKEEPKLKPFTSGNELLNGVIKIYNMLNPDFAKFLKIMKKHDMFDLESRKGKAPGGYNYSLQKTGMPFIFMNAVGLHKDLITLLHEGGHATHTFLMRDIPIIEYRNTPSEVAEFASMSMELLTMDFWNIFYKDSDALIKAKKDHIANIIDFFPWCISVDKFQHWVYTNPTHSVRERDNEWIKITKDFSEKYIDWSGFENYLKKSWHFQLHIFEAPFYYIEYGMAQLGALQIWRNYKNNPEKAIKCYTKALKLGNSKPISEIYNTAGVEFRFDEPFIKEIMDFTVSEYNKLG